MTPDLCLSAHPRSRRRQPTSRVPGSYRDSRHGDADDFERLFGGSIFAARRRMREGEAEGKEGGGKRRVGTKTGGGGAFLRRASHTCQIVLLLLVSCSQRDNSSCSPSALMSSFKTHQTHNVEKNTFIQSVGRKVSTFQRVRA